MSCSGRIGFKSRGVSACPYVHERVHTCLCLLQQQLVTVLSCQAGSGAQHVASSLFPPQSPTTLLIQPFQSFAS